MTDRIRPGVLFIVIFVAVFLAIVMGWFTIRLIQNAVDDNTIDGVTASTASDTSTTQAPVGQAECPDGYVFVPDLGCEHGHE